MADGECRARLSLNLLDVRRKAHPFQRLQHLYCSKSHTLTHAVVSAAESTPLFSVPGPSHPTYSATTAVAATTPSSSPARSHSLDNLRAALTALLIAHHTSSAPAKVSARRTTLSPPSSPWRCSPRWAPLVFVSGAAAQCAVHVKGGSAFFARRVGGNATVCAAVGGARARGARVSGGAGAGQRATHCPGRAERPACQCRPARVRRPAPRARRRARPPPCARCRARTARPRVPRVRVRRAGAGEHRCTTLEPYPPPRARARCARAATSLGCSTHIPRALDRMRLRAPHAPLPHAVRPLKKAQKAARRTCVYAPRRCA
ncbi:hypothetical protein HYPSUDRAFT_280419 [Hypholoma sublateritium FD-334 SS-4]|uniref:Uncharacterized protein n=1 Tax=Hypholoma sublateritium (strain FD-334 SS-4) TaxID=945553 RepID=A0A0D2MRK8_HYPSF|nr:hypothetical protein HYPSUDRAFT_280419 [Hypholoma sublateritium FD-334 SS-4]